MAGLSRRERQQPYIDAKLPGDPSSRWYAHSKSRTIDCDTCPLYQVANVVFPTGDERVEWCSHGVAGKVLNPTKIEKGCVLLDENGQPREFPLRENALNFSLPVKIGKPDLLVPNHDR